MRHVAMRSVAWRCAATVLGLVGLVEIGFKGDLPLLEGVQGVAASRSTTPASNRMMICSSVERGGPARQRLLASVCFSLRVSPARLPERPFHLEFFGRPFRTLSGDANVVEPGYWKRLQRRRRLLGAYLSFVADGDHCWRRRRTRPRARGVHLRATVEEHGIFVGIIRSVARSS